MDAFLKAMATAFQELPQRPAVFDREIRQQLGDWTVESPVAVSELLPQFQGHPEFVTDDGRVIVPIHGPDSADLTGEYLHYYPDHIVPAVVYYDYGRREFTRIPLEEFDETIVAHQLRFWHPDVEPPAPPSFHPTGEDVLEEPTVGADAVTSETPLPDEGEGLIEDLQLLISAQENAVREDARAQCKTLSPEHFLGDRGGIPEVVTAGIVEDDFGDQRLRLRLPDPDVDPNEIDLTDEYGVYPGAEVIVDALEHLDGFPIEAEVANVEGKQLELAPYWDRGPDNPSFDVFDVETDNRFLVGELLNPVPYDRKREAVDALAEDERKRGWLTGEGTIEFADEPVGSVSKHQLNTSQYRAAYRALRAKDVFCIHGPPGTGKTRTLIDIVRAATEADERVLAVAHSNQAVDNMLVGDSTAETTDPSSFHHLVETSDIEVARAGQHSDSDLVTDEYVQNDLYQSDVVCATMSGASQFGENIFDLAVVDEATQASIPDTLIPATRAKRVVLVGDHKQLPPYHSTETTEDEDFAVSLFEHLVGLYGEEITARLTTQYRMNEAIAAFPNQAFYDGQLDHGEKNRSWTLPSLAPMEAIHVTGEEQQRPTGSYYNETEAKLTAQEVTKILKTGIPASDVGVITPYSAQIGMIRSQLFDLADETPGDVSAVKIATVDAFQGSEREAIIVSFVRSNPQGFSGFLTFPTEGPRRLNVALTRARRRCVLIGNFDTLRTRAPTKEPAESSADVYQALFEHLRERGHLKEAREANV